MTENRNLAYKMRDATNWTECLSSNPEDYRTLCLKYVIATNGKRKDEIRGLTDKFQEQIKIDWMADKLTGYSHLLTTDKRIATNYVALYFAQGIEELVLKMFYSNMQRVKTQKCEYLLAGGDEPVDFYDSKENFHLNAEQIKSVFDKILTAREKQKMATK